MKEKKRRTKEAVDTYYICEDVDMVIQFTKLGISRNIKSFPSNALLAESQGAVWPDWAIFWTLGNN